MHSTILALVLAISMLPTASAVAEIYKYVDADGQKRWTDDLSQVPKEQRPSVERSTIPKEGSVPAQATGGRPAAAMAADTAPGAADGTLRSTNEVPTRKALEQEKADLDALYRQLMEERKALVDLRSGNLDTGARDELNRRVAAYNQKTEAYEKRLDRFNADVDRFNRQHRAATNAKAGQ